MISTKAIYKYLANLSNKPKAYAVIAGIITRAKTVDYMSKVTNEDCVVVISLIEVGENKYQIIFWPTLDGVTSAIAEGGSIDFNDDFISNVYGLEHGWPAHVNAAPTNDHFLDLLKAEPGHSDGLSVTVSDAVETVSNFYLAVLNAKRRDDKEMS